jgi:parallel beta-helix repeat protein
MLRTILFDLIIFLALITAQASDSINSSAKNSEPLLKPNNSSEIKSLGNVLASKDVIDNEKIIFKDLTYNYYKRQNNLEYELFSRANNNSQFGNYSLLAKAAYINARWLTGRNGDQIHASELPSNLSANLNWIPRNKTLPSSYGLRAGLDNLLTDLIYDYSRSDDFTMVLNGSFIKSNVSQKLTFSSINGTAAGRSDREIKRFALNNNSSLIVVFPGKSIQAAIDQATPGGLIEVMSGTYFENIHVNKPLVLVGLDSGEGYPTIDGRRSGNTIEITAKGVTIEGLIAVNSSGFGMDEPGAGIKVASDNCTIKRVRANNNYYGINLVESNSNTLSNNILDYNTCGVRLYFANNNIINNNNISNNTNGMSLSSSNNNTISLNTVTGNEYGIYLDSSSGNLLESNLLYNNSIESVESDEFSKSENKILNNTLMSNIKPASFVKTYLPDENELNGEVENPQSEDLQAHSSAINSDGGDGGDGEEASKMGYTQPTRPTATEELQKRIDEEIDRLPWGKITFTPPEKMSKGVTNPVVVRISRNLFENMTEELEKFERVETDRIKVSYEMNVKLDGGSAFKISPETQEPKIVPKSGYVEWKWDVTPLKPGVHILSLTAMATIYLKDGEKKIEENVFEKGIEVNVDQVREIKLFFLGSGLWIAGLFITTLVAGIIALLSGGIIDRLKSLKK